MTLNSLRIAKDDLELSRPGPTSTTVSAEGWGWNPGLRWPSHLAGLSVVVLTVCIPSHDQTGFDFAAWPRSPCKAVALPLCPHSGDHWLPSRHWVVLLETQDTLFSWLGFCGTDRIT